MFFAYAKINYSSRQLLTHLTFNMMVYRTKIQNLFGDTACRYGKPTFVAITIPKATNTTRKPNITSADRLNIKRVGISNPAINIPKPIINIASMLSGLSTGPFLPCIGMNISRENNV